MDWTKITNVRPGMEETTIYDMQLIYLEVKNRIKDCNIKITRQQNTKYSG